jgi:hypothetical protein
MNELYIVFKVKGSLNYLPILLMLPKILEALTTTESLCEVKLSREQPSKSQMESILSNL